MVTSSFAGRIGAIWLDAVRFRKRRGVLGERTVDLVGRDVQEAEGGFLSLWQTTPVGSHGLEQSEGADDVGLDEVLGALDGAVHMAFGGEVQHSAGFVLGYQSDHQREVTQVTLNKGMACIALQAGDVFQVTGVGEFVEIDYRLVALGQPVEHEVAANEASAPCNKNGHDFLNRSLRPGLSAHSRKVKIYDLAIVLVKAAH